MISKLFTYKKILRKLKHKQRKSFLNSVRYWENMTGRNKYKAGFFLNYDNNTISFWAG